MVKHAEIEEYGGTGLLTKERQYTEHMATLHSAVKGLIWVFVILYLEMTAVVVFSGIYLDRVMDKYMVNWIFFHYGLFLFSAACCAGGIIYLIKKTPKANDVRDAYEIYLQAIISESAGAKMPATPYKSFKEFSEENITVVS